MMPAVAPRAWVYSVAIMAMSMNSHSMPSAYCEIRNNRQLSAHRV